MQHIITPGMMYIHAGFFYLTYICTTSMIIVIGNFRNTHFACMTYSVRFPNCNEEHFYRHIKKTNVF